jgi:hypothetical protein
MNTTYGQRRFLRMFNRKLFILEIKTKTLINNIMSLIFRFVSTLQARKTLRVKRVGDFIYEGKYES